MDQNDKPRDSQPLETLNPDPKLADDASQAQPIADPVQPVASPEDSPQEGQEIPTVTADDLSVVLPEKPRNPTPILKPSED